MGVFSPDKKIYRKDFKRTLRKVPDLTKKERNYLEGAFQKDLDHGLTEYEFEKRVKQLKRNHSDPIDDSELSRVKDKISGKFGK